MARKKFITIILHLLVITVRVSTSTVSSNNVMPINTNITTSSKESDQIVTITNEWQQMSCMEKMCKFGKSFDSYDDTISTDVDESKQIHLALLLPSQPQVDQVNSQTLSEILPAIELAIENVAKQKLLNGLTLKIHPRDTQCSSTIGPIAAFDLHHRKEADIFLGPICDYVLAPVARYASFWQKPVISTGGLAAAFNFKVSIKKI